MKELFDPYNPNGASAAYSGPDDKPGNHNLEEHLFMTVQDLRMI